MSEKEYWKQFTVQNAYGLYLLFIECDQYS
jgi:hypothetical protein